MFFVFFVLFCFKQVHDKISKYLNRLAGDKKISVYIYISIQKIILSPLSPLQTVFTLPWMLLLLLLAWGQSISLVDPALDGDLCYGSWRFHRSLILLMTVPHCNNNVANSVYSKCLYCLLLKWEKTSAVTDEKALVLTNTSHNVKTSYDCSLWDQEFNEMNQIYSIILSGT